MLVKLRYIKGPTEATTDQLLKTLGCGSRV